MIAASDGGIVSCAALISANGAATLTAPTRSTTPGATPVRSAWRVARP
jgi:hypothetical protein